VDDEDNAFNQGELLCKEGVEENGERSDGAGQERTVPAFEDVIRVVEDDQALNLGASQEGGIGSARLPSKDAEPTDDEADEFLGVPRSKFRDPMVLSSRGRSPAVEELVCQMGQTQGPRARTWNPFRPSMYSHT
jgi:hypothetical protein